MLSANLPDPRKASLPLVRDHIVIDRNSTLAVHFIRYIIAMGKTRRGGHLEALSGIR